MPAQEVDHNFGLDLARFLAIAMVVVDHYAFVFLSMAGVATPLVVVMGGFFGVELFFVLSGFLIGRLLFRIVETDPTPRGWLVFMARRWLRTLPLYLGWLVVLAVVLPTPDHVGAHLLRYAILTQNLAWSMPADQWFNESWSLALEEWFYILFSVALIGTAAVTRGTRMVWPVIVAFLAIPPVLRVLRPAHGDADTDAFFNEHVYHIVLYRLDVIAYGVALAKLHRQGSKIFQYPWAMFSAGFVLIAAFWQQDSYGMWLPVSRMVYLHLQLIAVAVGFCLLLAAVLRLPAWPDPLGWVVRTGARVSYGIYIMNLGIIYFVVWRAGQLGWGLAFQVPVSVLLVLLLPYLSQRFYEAPFMRLRPSQARPPALDDGAYGARQVS
jgi:peptidoglycan/LPS O-acetylase OafA/YrhL